MICPFGISLSLLSDARARLCVASRPAALAPIRLFVGRAPPTSHQYRSVYHCARGVPGGDARVSCAVRGRAGVAAAYGRIGQRSETNDIGLHFQWRYQSFAIFLSSKRIQKMTPHSVQLSAKNALLFVRHCVLNHLINIFVVYSPPTRIPISSHPVTTRRRPSHARLSRASPLHRVARSTHARSSH